MTMFVIESGIPVVLQTRVEGFLWSVISLMCTQLYHNAYLKKLKIAVQGMKDYFTKIRT